MPPSEPLSDLDSMEPPPADTILCLATQRQRRERKQPLVIHTSPVRAPRPPAPACARRLHLLYDHRGETSLPRYAHPAVLYVRVPLLTPLPPPVRCVPCETPCACAFASADACGEHPIADFLPVQVELTDGSSHDASKSLAYKKQRFCITGKCVARLREFCSRVRPDLIQRGDGS